MTRRYMQADDRLYYLYAAMAFASEAKSGSRKRRNYYSDLAAYFLNLL